MKDILKGIKNIIFDFGGVILNLDMQRCINEFTKLGIADMGEFYLGVSEHQIFTKLEKGEIGDQIFYDEVKSFLPSGATNQQIELAWNAMLLDIPAHRIALIDRLNREKEFRTFLLSNTNAIHYEHYVGNLTKKYGYRDFSELFEKDYFSHKLGLKKPDIEIYNFVLKDARLRPEETLFIDDSPANLIGAAALGIRTFLLTPDIDVTELFPF